jgi:hypothetical protein
MTTQATVTTSPILAIPLPAIRRIIKQKPKYILGIFYCDAVSLPRIPNPRDRWTAFLTSLVDHMKAEWKVEPQLVVPLEDELESHSRQPSKSRYNLVDEVSAWRQKELCIVDLGQNETARLCRYGRHCDGVALVASSDLGTVKKKLLGLKRESIPWIGYWTMACESSTIDPVAA